MLQPAHLPADCPTRASGRWKRFATWSAAFVLLLTIVVAVVVKDEVRTLYSLRKVPGTNAYVMDYYGDYHLDEIRTGGMDVHNIEDSCLQTLFPDFVLPIARRLKRMYMPQEITITDLVQHHCSTVAIRSGDGSVFFGRNYDYSNDACLILRIHDRHGIASVAIIDLAFLNLNRRNLDRTSLVERVPLLFAPYYVMDGMNRHGLAVSIMSVDHAEPTITPGNPAIIEPTLMRLMLDYARNVDEAIALARQYNIYFVEAQLHLMIADAHGNSRILEHIDGDLRVTPADAPWQVCTNSIVWEKSESEKDDVCWRYQTASKLADELHQETRITDAQHVIQSMVQPQATMWTSLYNLTTGDFSIAYRSKFDLAYRDAIPHRGNKNSEPGK